jgi:erythromycin esterase
MIQLDVDKGFLRWARAHAIAVPKSTSGSRRADLRALQSLIGSARVVALGEPTHGAHEPLVFRNELFRYLVEKLGFTAIALETGLPESRRIADYVRGGPGDPRQIAHENLTWGFGEFLENVELLRWMQAYNLNPAHRRKLRFYGIDLSLGGSGGSVPTLVALTHALTYLKCVDSISAKRLQKALALYVAALSGTATLTPVEHDQATATLDDLIAQFERERPAFIQATSASEYEWAHRNALVAQQGDRVFRVLPSAVPGGGIPPKAWNAVSARDSAMATNLEWALGQEGLFGRILVFAHNMHVKNAPTEGGVWSHFERPPTVMGQYLRSILGDKLVIIGTSSAHRGNRDAGISVDPVSLDTALAQVGASRFLLDLRAARSDPAASAWLRERHALRTNETTLVMVLPATAFDAFYFTETLTPARVTLPLTTKGSGN